MAQALRNANVEVDERFYQETTHCFLEAVGIAAISNKVFDEAAH